MYYVVHTGTKLYRVSSAGTPTELTLPTGITLVSTRKARMAILMDHILVVNAPSRNLWIDNTGTVRPMTLQPPAGRIRLSVGTMTGLTGTFRVKCSYFIKDAEGRLICESPLSQASTASSTLANQSLKANEVPLSSDTRVTGRRLYRTATGPGTLYYHWLDIDDNRQSSVDDNLSDAGLALLPSMGELGSPPGTAGGSRMKLIAAWGERLWGVGSDDPDLLRFSEARQFYAWPAANEYAIKPVGIDAEGITAFMPRRDELAVAKRDSISKVTGSSPDDYQVTKVVEGTGCVSQESVVVIRDVAYFLSEDGVFSFGPDGVRSLSRERVHAWFTTDTYFNRSRFDNAFALWNPKLDTYDLFLANLGSSSEDRWVSLHLSGPYKGAWTGPHKTDAFTPTHGGLIEDASDQALPLIGGSDGVLYKMNQSVFTDGAATAIDFDVTTSWLNAKTPDIEKIWMQPSVINGIESSGNLTVTPTVGDVNAAAGADITVPLTVGRTRLRRLGLGRLLRYRLRQATNAVGVKVFGIEQPFHERGRR